MRHANKVNRLNRDHAHRKAMLNNLATSVLSRGLSEDPMKRHVVTTVPKAKVVRSLVERLITYAKKGDLAARRQAARFVKEKEVLRGLFETLGPRYANRQGGYTRVLKLSSNRHGDNAEMAIITVVEEEIRKRTKKKPARAKAQGKKIDITKSEGDAAATPAETAAPEAQASAALAAPAA